MAGKRHGKMPLVECAAHLEKNVKKWADPACAVDTDSALVLLQGWIAEARSYAQSTKSECLPVRLALLLQAAGQECWNATVLLPWPEERRTLKHKSRQLAAFIFLAGHYVFAEPVATAAHLVHHTDDAVKCLLMCLKVSKSLAKVYGNSRDAKEFLVIAGVVDAVLPRQNTAQLRQFALEIHFAQLQVAWVTGEFDAACTIANTIAEETKHSATYREALLEFIHNAAVEVAQHENKSATPDATADTQKQAQTLPPPSPANKGGDTNTEMAKRAAVQQLLLLSIKLQRQETIRTLKQKTMLGTTELQLSWFFLRSEDYAETAKYATAAQEHLDSVEPRIVLLRALAMQHDVAETARVFAALCDRTAVVSVASLCMMAAGVVDANPEMQSDIAAQLHQRATAESCDASDRFRFLCFLLHSPTEWSVSELLRHLSGEPAIEIRFHRFFFASLWRLSGGPVSASEGDEGDDEDDELRNDESQKPPAFSAAMKWDCLNLALRTFSENGSSSAEREMVLLDLTRLALELDAGNAPILDDGAVSSTSSRVQQTHELWTRCAPSETEFTVAAALAQAQLAFLLQREEDALQHVDTIRADADEDGMKRTCAALISFLLKHSLKAEAASVARRCLPRLTSTRSAECVLNFARVCALGLLESGSNSVEDELYVETAALLVTHVCPLLCSTDAQLPSATAVWWSRLLWVLSDALSEAAPAEALRLSMTAVCLHQQTPGPTTAAFSVVLRKHICALLEMEFDAFILDDGVLTLAELQQLHALLPNDGESKQETEESERETVVRALSVVEAEVRRVQQLPVTEVAEALNKDVFAELTALPCADSHDLERAARMCARVAKSSSEVCIALLRQAVQLQLSAATQNETKLRGARHPHVLTYTVPMVFDAYIMAGGDAAMHRKVFDLLLRLLQDNAEALQSVSSAPSEGAAEAALMRTQSRFLLMPTLEFFAVEAWNACVQANALQKREDVARWREYALHLAHTLDDMNAARISILDLASQMPLL